MFIGYPGSVHDSRIFKTSPLYTSLATKCVDKFIIADSAYPCLRNLLTPYRDNGHLTATQTYFNYKLSNSRIAIEHTFGILKQKFRQLYHLKLRNMHTICHFIRACCVLHNMTISDGIDTETSSNEITEDGINDIDIIDDIDNEPEVEVAGNYYRNYVAAVLYNNRA